jgi:Cu(I)/Ag(I) efflux system membrane fusion protein
MNSTSNHTPRTGADARRVITLLIAVALGFGLHALLVPGQEAQDSTSAAPAKDAQAVQWSCSMHPHILLPEAGDCPLCGMDLTPIHAGPTGGAGGGDRNEPLLRTSPESRALMRVETFPVERRFVERDLPLVGRVTVDDTRLAHLTSWVGGRLDRLFVNSTGVQVIEGDHMVSIYSPELVAAQGEFLAALRSPALSSSEEGRGTYVEAARDKLRLLGLSHAQLAEIESAGVASEHITILAPRSGTVIEQHVFEGMYVKTGTRIFTIADLSRLWVVLDAYESDLPWLRYGQKVSFTIDAVPGEVFQGKIGLIDPVLDPATRTVKVRVQVDNTAGLLKPEMFVRAHVFATVASNGRVLDPELEGRYICPMHPEVVADGPDACPECGMDLVPAEELGYVVADTAAAVAPIVIPRSAPLITGRRAVVYVELPAEEGETGPSGIFEGREIVLGPRAGEWYVVREGLKEGERVVVKGNFKIDSALQIQARPSMMSMAGDEPGEPGPPDLTADAVQRIGNTLDAYLTLQTRLAGDDLAGARSAAAAVADALGAPVPEAFTSLAESARALADAQEMDTLRAAFQQVSDALAPLLARMPPDAVTGDAPLVRAHCPMAFDFQGADWIQRGRGILNPYFGDAMLTCGSVVEVYGDGAGQGADTAGEEK